MEILILYFSDTYNNLRSAVANLKTSPSFDNILTQLGFYFTLYLLFCYVVYIISTVFRVQLSRNYLELRAKRVLLVIAHPDDECMFFGPMIVRMVNSGRIVYILCLSNGNSQNLGQLRKQELWDSCKVLGVASENIILCCSPQRQDGHQFEWKADIIASLILDYVEQFEIDSVVTFDKRGVSGHPNHIALFKALSFLALRNWLPHNCHMFLLDSLSIMRKYSSLADCALSFLTSEHFFVLSPLEHETVKEAMKMHKTQFVWFRKLYMCFSRYTYINTFNELPRFQG